MFWSSIAQLAPIVLLVVEFVKKKFKLTGWPVNVVALVVSMVASAIYGGTAGWAVWKIITIGIGLTVGVGAGFDVVKEFCSFVGTKK